MKKTAKSNSNIDFDFATEGTQVANSTSEFAALMAAWKPSAAPTHNSVVTGEVVQSTKKGFLVDIGQKSDAFVDASEAADLQVGDRAQFIVIHTGEDSEDSVELSYVRMSRWTKLAEKRDARETVQVVPASIAKTKSGGIVGLNVVLDGQRGFIPRSEIDVRGNLNDLIDAQSPLNVKVLSADPSKGQRGELILSQKRVAEEQQDSVIASLSVGAVVEGQVHHILDKEQGVLVKLGGGVTALCHRTELSEDRRRRCAEIVKVGATVKAVITKIDAGTRKVSLSIKKAKQAQAFGTLVKGAVVKGRVDHFVDFGVFVDVDGVQGLLHLSEIPNSNGVKEQYKENDEIIVRVLDVDAKRNRVALSRKNIKLA